MTSSNISSESGYAHRRKQLLALTKDLRAVGAHTHLDLPRIVVIGNQSAGKSSLIEAISGIKVPRDAGTCTRCPMECRLLSSDDAWSCQVSIRWEYDRDGKRRPSNEISEDRFGNLLADKSEVEMMLRRAQAAVLNIDSGLPLSYFLTLETDDLGSLSSHSRPNVLAFSHNVVCVDISGPELTDLSFVDLPGIIQNADDDVVHFVERMVKSHLLGNSLIVVAIPMSDDIENQRALRLALEADRHGSRTIGVLTKPDMVGSGSIKAKGLWLDILEGRSHTLQHGYYCTHQPDDAERATGITPEKAREAEAAFFAETPPWSSSQGQHRFGTKNLVKYLSTMLTEIIDAVLPQLEREVTSKLAECSFALQQLPEQVMGEPASIVLSLVSTFCTDVHAHVLGAPQKETLVQQNRRTYERFKRTIRATAPRFVPLSAKDFPQRSWPQFQQMPESSEDEEDGEDGEGDENEDKGHRSVQTMRPADNIYLEDMQAHIQRSVTRELPFNVPYPAKTMLIRDFEMNWMKGCHACFEDVEERFRNALAKLVRDGFGRFQNLKVKIDAALAELLRERRAATLAQIAILLKLETTPFTQNTHYLSHTTDRILSRYKDIRVHKLTVSKPTASPAKVEQPSAVRSTSNGLSNGSNMFAPFVSEPKSYLAHPLPPRTPIPDSWDWDEPAPPVEDESVKARKGKKKGGRNYRNVHETEDVSTDGRADGSFPGAFGASATQPAPLNGSAFSASVPSAANTPNVFGLKTAPTPFGAGFLDNSFSFPKQSHAQGSHTPVPVPIVDERKQLEAEALAALAKLGYVGLTADDLGKLNPPDEYEEELKLMAEVRAYFQVSYKRIIDYIPLAIDHMFLFAFSEALQFCLINKLGLGSSDATARCATYLVEDADIVIRRKELTGKMASLERAKTELLSFSLQALTVTDPS